MSFAWSFEEILGIDPWIVKHKIKMYPNSKLDLQKLKVISSKKAPEIKAKIEKFLRYCFIYHVPLIEWVSNLVPVNKKQGTICVCTKFCDFNKSSPKDN